MTFNSVYEITNNLSTIAGQHMIEYFTGNSLDDRWNETNNTGTNTFAMADEVDGGFKLTLQAVSVAQMAINFNDKRQYSPTGSVAIMIAKAPVTNCYTDFGFSNNILHSNAQSAFFRFTDQYGGGKIGFITAGAGTTRDVSTSVDTSTDWFALKIECESTSISSSINGVLEVTNTDRLPTLDLQPSVKHQNTDSTSRSCQIRYFEAYNT